MLGPSLEGPNCADLPPQAVDHLFNGEAEPRKVFAQAAKNICARCVVQDECLTTALNAMSLPERGVIAGHSASSIHVARSWRSYEQGLTEHAPRRPRPGWLARSDATETTEQARLEAEEGVER